MWPGLPVGYSSDGSSLYHIILIYDRPPPPNVAKFVVIQRAFPVFTVCCSVLFSILYSVLYSVLGKKMRCPGKWLISWSWTWFQTCAVRSNIGELLSALCVFATKWNRGFRPFASKGCRHFVFHWDRSFFASRPAARFSTVAGMEGQGLLQSDKQIRKSE